MTKGWLRWVPALLWCLIIYVSTDSPAFTADSTRELLGPLNFALRKGAHLASFGLLAVLFRFALGPGRRAPGLIAWALTVVYAASDELHQRFVPGRGASLDDVLLDALGAALALLLWEGVGRLRRKRQLAK